MALQAHMRLTVSIVMDACEDTLRLFHLLICFRRACFSPTSSNSLSSPCSNLGLSCVSSTSNRWWRLTTSRCTCLLSSCRFWKRPLSEGDGDLVHSCRWAVTRTEAPSESTHPAYSVHNQASRVGTVGEGCIEWVTRHGWPLRHWWSGQTKWCPKCVSDSDDKGTKASLLSEVEATSLDAAEA